MGNAERFEDLVVWQEARLLRKEVSAASKEGAFAKDFEMRGQIRSAALSVMNNIAEGFERGSNKEFAQFLNIAKGSVGEVRSVLYAALDDSYLSQVEFDRLYDRALSVARRCSRFITYLVNAQRTRPHAPAAPNPKPAPPADLKT
jgi:four helix bundle protein